MRLISVVMGTPSIKAREYANAALLNYGFTFFETAKLKSRGETIAEAARVQVRGRDRGGRPRTRHRTSPWRAAKRRLSRPPSSVNEPLIAPLAANKPVGELTITNAAGDVVARAPLVSAEGRAEGGLVDAHGRQRGALVQMTR